MALYAVGGGKYAEIMVDFGEKRQQTALWEGIPGSEGGELREINLADKEVRVFVTLIVKIHRVVDILR